MMLQYWHWVVFGLLLIILEVMVPGAFFLWIGITAFILGAVCFIFPFTSVAAQLLLFGILSIVITVLGRKVMRNVSRQAPPTLLNRRGQQLVGEVISIDAPIINGYAHVTVGDSKWRVKGSDMPKGSVVQIVGVDGNTLIVVAKE